MPRTDGAPGVRPSHAITSVGLEKHFSGVPALRGVDISVANGEIFGLLGPNGSGKTTWMNCVTGVLKPDAGRVTVAGKDVTRMRPHRIYAHGIGRTFQRLENFPRLSVIENLLLAVQESYGSLLGRMLRFDERRDRERAREILRFVGLERVADEVTRTLSYGQQKLCDLAMVLMGDPQIVLLDEPMAGVNPALIEEIMGLITRMNRDGKTVVIIEHNMRVVMELCDRLAVLVDGEKVADGDPETVRADPVLMDAYFGR